MAPVFFSAADAGRATNKTTIQMPVRFNILLSLWPSEDGEYCLSDPRGGLDMFGSYVDRAAWSVEGSLAQTGQRRESYVSGVIAVWVRA